MRWIPPLVLAVATTAAAQPIIIDHTCTNPALIPESYITAAKASLRVGYGHTSHGSQLITGLDATRTLAVTLAVREAAQSGRRIDLA